MRFFALLLIAALTGLLGTGVHSAPQKKSIPQDTPMRVPSQGEAEARLLEIYALVGKAQPREALRKAQALVKDHPNFQLAQLVYGDLLTLQTQPIKTFGDVPAGLPEKAQQTLQDLQEESQRRIKALRERPPEGTIPSQFLALSQRSKHAIAVDASRSRLYLFANQPNGLKLIADYYISVGKAGTSKMVEGDQRTPLGVYYITSNLDPKSLQDFYGSGALPINYPNVLDTKRGKTGSGIWLHGTPSNQFSRPPQASDGCVVLANPDLEHILRTVQVRTTPVVIAAQLQWVHPQSTQAESQSFQDTLQAWRNAKTTGNLDKVLSFYTADFRSNGKNLEQWKPVLRTEVNKVRGRNIQLKDLSYLRWIDSADTMVVSFGEVAEGTKVGLNKRQYWMRQGNQWKIFFEGAL